MGDPGPDQGPLAGRGKEPVEPLLSLLTQGLLSLLQFTLLPRPCSVVFSSLQPRGLQHATLPCPLPSVCSSSCPLSMMPSSHLLLSTPSPGHLPSIFPSIRVFSRVSSSHQIAKVLEFSFSPSNECSGLISFRIDWFDLLTVQGSLKSSLSNHSSKASILWCPAFLMVQLSRPYMTTYCKDHSFD